MAHLRFDSPELWEQWPEALQGLRSAMREGVRMAFLSLGDPGADPPTVGILDLAPGGVVDRHAHPCARVEVIVRGTLQVDGEWYGPGDVMTAEPGEFYGPHVAGPDGCTTAEVFSSFTAAHTLLVETGDGATTEVDVTDPRALRALYADQLARRASRS